MWSLQKKRVSQKGICYMYVISIIMLLVCCYASRRSRTRDTVKLTVCLCVCLSVPAVTAQRLQCDEN